MNSHFLFGDFKVCNPWDFLKDFKESSQTTYIKGEGKHYFDNISFRRKRYQILLICLQRNLSKKINSFHLQFYIKWRKILSFICKSFDTAIFQPYFEGHS